MEVLDYRRKVSIILGECEATLGSINQQDFDILIEYILESKQVFFIGVGRVFLSLKATAKRLAHCGIRAICVGQIDEPAITKEDILIVASGSGESLIPVAISKKAKSLGAKVILISSNPQSTIQQIADHFLRIAVNNKLSLSEGIKSVQPMTSLFEQSLLLLGDIVAMSVIERKQLNMDDLWRYHANLE